MTPWAKDKLAASPDKDRILARAKAMGVTLGALWAPSKREWQVSAAGNGVRVLLNAHGPLAAVLDGVMDDYETAVA